MARVPTPVPRFGPDVITAMICSGTVAAQFVAGKAVRDALYLARMDVTTLPVMVAVTSAVSMAIAAASSRWTNRTPPRRVVPALFAISAAGLLIEWMLSARAPRLAAVLVYLHVSGLGPMLGSGFWLIASECFDPRTARRRFGQIQGVGTLGGVAGGLLAERVGSVLGAVSILPTLAALSLVCAWTSWRLAVAAEAEGRTISATNAPDLAPAAPRSGLRVLADEPYLRNLAALVLLGTMSAALVDYVFKVEAVSAFGRGADLLRFFAIYYAATSLITFFVQAGSSQLALDRFGLGLTIGLPSLALVAGGLGGLLVRGLGAVTLARGGEAVVRGSLFRAGYELYYTPIPAAQKRAAKSLIDVGLDRLGDALGAGLVRLVLQLGPALQYSALLLIASASSAAALLFASRLNRGYVETLEKNLLNRALDLDLVDAQDATTRTTMIRTIKRPQLTQGARSVAENVSRTTPSVPAPFDPEIEEVRWLRSRDPDKVRRVLRAEDGLTAALVPHVIPLLAWDRVANDAVFALRKVAEEFVGQLTDALIDPNQDFAVRRRLARVFSVCVSPRGAEGLLLGLDDLRFEVRFQCGRSLAAIQDTNPRIRIDRDRVLEVVLREVTVGRPVWESRRLLDGVEALGDLALDELLRDRASQSLAHVFTLLSLVLPREPLQVAFRGLHTDDRHFRGTALEYLDGVLPPAIRERLWPFLEAERYPTAPTRPQAEIVADLLRSNQSIVINLEELRRRT